MTPGQNRELLDDFLLEARDRCERVESSLLTLTASPADAPEELLDQLRRDLHTLKGNAGLVGLAEIQTLTHGMEDTLEKLDRGGVAVVNALLRDVDRLRAMMRAAAGQAEESARGEGHLAGVRLGFSQLDRLVDLVGEMVIFRNRHGDDLETWVDLKKAHGEGLSQSWDQLSATLSRLRDEILRLRMIPLETLFRSLHRLVHDEAGRAGKQVELETRGGETPLDRALLELASDALAHLVRNAVIHGLESPETRRQRRKPARGTIRIAATTAGQEIHVEISDDGRGIDPDEVRQAARRLGIPLSSDDNPFQLLFRPGFTTRPEADLSAGRGIGLSAVQEAVARQGGRVEVYSEKGRGTLFRLRLPLSVSIARALLLGCDGETYALPISVILETLALRAEEIHEINGAGVIRWRDEIVPLLDVGAAFGTSPARRPAGFAVLLAGEGKNRALLVDELQGIREVVVKPLDELAGQPQGIAGSTVLGDGRAILILDPVGLLSLSPRTQGRRAA